jgi:hypothetical protein
MTNREILMDLTKELLHLDTKDDEKSKKMFLTILEDVAWFSKEVAKAIKAEM